MRTGGRDKGGEAVRACLALIELKRRFAGNRTDERRRRTDGDARRGRAAGRRRRRSVARLAAVQALYQLELNPGAAPKR